MRLVPASRRRRQQAGLTLIELVVVLLVLTALAGVLIPFATQITQRTHGSAGAANIEETTKSITRFEVERFRQPDNSQQIYLHQERYCFTPCSIAF